MGHDERTKIVATEHELILYLDSMGVITTEDDVRLLAYIINHVAKFMITREQGYCLLLNGLLEGDFHLESDRSIAGLGLPLRKQLFIPMYSIKRAIGDIEIEFEEGRNGYTIRRKT